MREFICRKLRPTPTKGIILLILDNAGYDDKEGLQKMLNRVDLVVASCVVIDAVKSMVPKGVQVMEFYNFPLLRKNIGAPPANALG